MQQQKQSPLRFAARAGAAFGLALAVLFALLLAAYALPGEPLRDNLIHSAATMQREGLYPEFFGFKLFQMDNYTDTLMLFEAATADEADPLTSMMTNTAYNIDNYETLADDLEFYLQKDLATGAQNPNPPTLTAFSYARYWHGYLIWLRPLLLLMPYAGVRVVQYLVLAALLGVVLWRLKRRCGLRVAVWFALSQLLVTVFFVPHQIQFFTCFAVAYAGSAWVLGGKPKTAQDLAVGLVVLGCCTVFLDLLVTPIITLGLPVAVWLLCPLQRRQAGLGQCAVVVGGSLCWGVGYGVCWASKWVLASLMTGQDIIGDALHQVGVRTSADTWRGIELSWGNIFRFVYQTLADKGLLWPLVLALLFAVALFCLCVRGKAQLQAALPLALVALMAPVWFVLLRTHSIQHGWFTWRALAPSIFAGLAFVYYACSPKAALKRLKRR